MIVNKLLTHLLIMTSEAAENKKCYILIEVNNTNILAKL